MTQPPVAQTNLPASATARTPIGTVTILVYALEAGQSEVQVQWPRQALAGTQAENLASQAQFGQLVQSELSTSLNILATPPPTAGS